MRSQATEGQIVQKGEFSGSVASDGRQMAGICFAALCTLQPLKIGTGNIPWAEPMLKTNIYVWKTTIL